jgi:tetratricopeptide (TPR) repeat protein
MAVVILPVTVRNLVVADEQVLIASQGGINLYIGNNDAADGVSAVMPEPTGFNWRIQQVTHIAERELGRSLKPGEVSSFWYGQAIDWILENPGDFMLLYLKKLYFSFSNREISNNRNLEVFFDRIALLRYNPLSFGILFSLTAVAFILCLGGNQRGVFLLVLIITYTIVSALFFFSSRFRLPLLPFYIILSSASLHWITSRMFSRWRSVLWPITGCIVFGFFSFYPVAGVPSHSSSQHLISEGLYYLATEQYRPALSKFLLARQIDMAFPETNLNIGSAYMRLGQLDSALYYLHEEERLNPARAKANINIASVYLLTGDFKSASREIQVAIDSRPYDVIANMIALRVLFADSLISTADLADSVDHLARRGDYHIRLLNDAAVRFSSRGEMELAEALLRQAIASKPPPVETDDYAFERNYINSPANWARERAKSYYQLGFINGLRGNFDLSIEYSKQAIKLDSFYAEAYVNLISGYISAGRLAEARTTLAEAASRFPDNEYIRQIQTRIGQ